jgi:hypothetical protein
VSVLVILKNGALESTAPRTSSHTTGVAFEQVNWHIITTMDTSTITWPWMKDGKVTPRTTPAPSVHAMDDRPALVDVIAAHRTKIDQVAADLATDPLFRPSKHDDLWIVRFLLSHKNVKSATKAAHSTLQFRAQHKLDETDIRYSPPNPMYTASRFESFTTIAKPIRSRLSFRMLNWMWCAFSPLAVLISTVSSRIWTSHIGCPR